MNRIIDLQETSPNHWRAKYRGSYGTYTIKIKTSGEESEDFSCTCPSSYYPCKHIFIVQDAIKERVNRTLKEGGGVLFEDAVRSMNLEQLQEFTLRFGLHNPSFQQSVLLEFAPTQQETDDNRYLEIIRAGLEEVYYDCEDICEYYDECLEIDALDQWISKAKKHLEEGNYAEAVLIAKACIEEYANWLDANDPEVHDYMSEDYLYAPFKIIGEAYKSGHVNAAELVDYCKEEMKKRKYDCISIKLFEQIIMQVTKDTNPEAFIAMQDELFNSLSDKAGYEAKKILERKIDFYKSKGNDVRAWNIVEENMQIEEFCRQVVEKRIAENKFKEAKKIINDYIRDNTKGIEPYLKDSYSARWNEYLLAIAQKENDVKTMRKISLEFIQKNFLLDYYRIYKSTFSADVWGAQVESLIKHYQKESCWNCSNVANVLVEEKQTERLLAYLSHNLHLGFLNDYCKYTSPTHPVETLALFEQAIDKLMENTGRAVYETAVRNFKIMLEIEGGGDLVRRMINNYEARYKGRKAMLEVFAEFRKKRG